LILRDGRLIARIVLIQRSARQSDGNGGDVASGFDSVQTLLDGLPDISNVSRVDASNLMKTGNSSLQDFSNSNCLVDGSSHSLEDNIVVGLFLIAK